MTVRVLAHDAGVSWIVEDEMLQRASHAVAAPGGGALLIDPVDDPAALAEVERTFGTVTGVLQLLDRHPRDGAALAERFGVGLQRLPEVVDGYETFDVVSVPRWRERGLWAPESGMLVVPEAIGTVPYFTTGTGAAGVHPFLRGLPPRGLGRFLPGLEHLLCGHGAPLHGDAARTGLRVALDRARKDLPRLPLAMLRAR